MQGDFSRFTFRNDKHYRLVLRQQGRVDVDADWNEQQQILRHFGETEGADVIGPTGVPKGTNGFAVAADPKASSGLTVAPGRIYVDGILCENDAPSPVDLFGQPDLPSTGGTLAGVALPPAGAATYVAYLEVFLRHLTARQDSEIREKALGGPDTASRAKVVWQVKLQPVAAGSACSAFAPPAAPGGTLKASTAAVAAPTPCTIPPTAGFRRLENQLYRVEVHLGSDSGTPTFKWSRENASIVTGVVDINGQTISVTDLGRDDVTLGFKNAQWVELIDDRSELNAGHGTLLLVDKAAGNSVIIKADTPVPAPGLAPGQTLASLHFRLRRWEQTGPAAGAGAVANGVAIGPGPFPLEDGLQVEFLGTGYRSGDHWLIPARTAIDGDTGNIEWPSVSGVFQFVPPFGVARHYCPLAVVAYAGGGAAPTVPFDCRKFFPPLTNITASDVTVNVDTCGLPGVTTVQQQIDALCGATGGCCAQTLGPGMDWKTALKQLKGPVASVCFQVGDYVLDAPARFAEFTSLKITGSGPGTRILAPKSQAAFVFTSCRSVEVTDLYAEADQTGGKRGPDKLKGAGVLTFQSCNSVRVDGVTLRGAEDVTFAAPTVRTASCIEVCGNPNAGNGQDPPTSARIIRSDLTVGRFQEGIVVTDMGRVQVEDNTLTVVPTPAVFRIEPLLANLSVRSNVRRLLMSVGSVVAARPNLGAVVRPTLPQEQTPVAPAATSAVEAVPPQPQPATKSEPSPPKPPPGPTAADTRTTPPAPPPAEAPRPVTSEAPPEPTRTVPPESDKPASAPLKGESQPGLPPPAATTAPVTTPTPTAVEPQRSKAKLVTVTVGNDTLQFHTPNALVNVWTSVLALPQLAARPGETLSKRVGRAADALLLNPKVRYQFPGVAAWWSTFTKGFISMPLPAAQGIVVAGSKATDVRIRDNTLIGASQGIHVGLSHRGAGRSNPRANQRGGADVATNVMITGNTVTVFGSVALRGHEGIFVGNCDNLVVKDNSLTAVLPVTFQSFPGDGILVFGWLGPMAVISHNRLRNFSPNSAVIFHPLNPPPGSSTWVVSENQTVG